MTAPKWSKPSGKTVRSPSIRRELTCQDGIIIGKYMHTVRTIIACHKVKYDRPGECSPEKDCLR